MKNNSLASLLAVSLLSAVAMLTACSTDAELCYDPVHPHTSDVKFEYDWRSYTPEAEGVTGMYVIADRVINHWKAALEVHPTNYTGTFLYNGPEIAEPEITEPEVTVPEDTEEPPVVEPGEENPGGTGAEAKRTTLTRDDTDDDTSDGDDIDTGDDTDDDTDTGSTPVDTPTDKIYSAFPLRTGDYKFVTFNYGDKELDYTEVDEYLYDQTSALNMQDIYIYYKSYAKESSEMKRLTDDWQDYNNYAGYIQPNEARVYFDTVPGQSVLHNIPLTVKFRPKPITQEIEVTFTIKKNTREMPFKIDSVKCEISGIPYQLNIFNGYLRIDETRRMMFDMEPINDRIGSSASIPVRGTIHVPSIVYSTDPTVSTGPGILQVLIWASTWKYETEYKVGPDGNVVLDYKYDDQGNKIVEQGQVPERDENDNIIYVTGEDGKPTTRTVTGNVRLYKKIQGKINLYNTLKRANLMTRSEDGQHAVRNGEKGALNIDVDLTINGKDVEENYDNNGGIDVWKDCPVEDNYHVDI